MEAALLVVGLLVILLVALARQRRWPRLRPLSGGLLVSLVTLLLMFGLLEGYFRFVHAESSNIITLATQNWLDRYWRTNSWGFRDREWQPADYEGRQIVLVLGDSFAAGWGLPEVADRFSAVLGSELGAGYAVMNAAVYGTATVEQTAILRDFPVQPDVVIWQYFLNDINYTGLTLGLLPEPAPLPGWARQSYFLNYIYWTFLQRATADADLYDRWWQWSYDAYDNAGLWGPHSAEMDAMIEAVNTRGARLIVVIFPNPLEIMRSIPYVDRVAQHLESRGVTDVLKLFDAMAAWPAGDLLVSARDSHTSASFNHWLGQELYRVYFQD